MAAIMAWTWACRPGLVVLTESTSMLIDVPASPVSPGGQQKRVHEDGYRFVRVRSSPDRGPDPTEPARAPRIRSVRRVTAIRPRSLNVVVPVRLLGPPGHAVVLTAKALPA